MLGEVLKILRIFYGYKAKELSDKLDISQSFLSEIENGKKNPTIDLLNKYSEVFKIKLSTIILLSESIDLKKENQDVKHNIANIGIKVLKILQEQGDLND